MENLNDFQEKPEKKKIPYDQEPIIRGTRRVPSVSSAGQKNSSKLVNVLVSVLCIVTIVFGVLIGVLFKRTGDKGSTLSPNYPESTYKKNELVAEESISDTATAYAMRSAVTVQAMISAPNPDLKHNAGSGVIIDDTNGYVTIVTNYHVCYLASEGKVSSEIYVFLYDYVNPENNSDIYYASRILCEYVGGSYNNDIAVLRFSRGTTYAPTAAEKLYLESKAQPVTIGDSNNLSFGDNVFAIGNPAGLGINVTTGVVSKPYTLVNVDVRSDGSSPYEVLRCIQVDAAINKGNSGGGLFDANGHWMGIVNAKQEELENFGFAIPVNVAYGVAWNIVQNSGSLKICTIGVDLENDTYIEEDDKGAIEYKNKVIVDAVSILTPAAYAGIKAGDWILQVTYTNRATGKSVTIDIDKPYEVHEQMYYVASGDKITIVVDRSGTRKTLEVTLGSANVVY